MRLTHPQLLRHHIGDHIGGIHLTLACCLHRPPGLFRSLRLHCCKLLHKLIIIQLREERPVVVEDRCHAGDLHGLIVEQETEVRKELVQDKLKNDPRILNFTPILDGEVPVYDELTGQILSCTRERLDLKILQGEKEGNGWDGMSVNEWLLILGARRMKMGDDSGWNERTGFEVCVETIEVDHRIPCYYLNYLIPPKEDFR